MVGEEKITLVLNRAQVGVIGAALGKLPYESSAKLIEEIRSQCVEFNKKKDDQSMKKESATEADNAI